MGVHTADLGLEFGDFGGEAVRRAVGEGPLGVSCDVVQLSLQRLGSHAHEEDLPVPRVLGRLDHVVHGRRRREQHHHAGQVVADVGEHRRADEAVARDVSERVARAGLAADGLERLHGLQQTPQVPLKLADLSLDTSLAAEHGQAHFAGRVGSDHRLQEALQEGLEAEEALQGERGGALQQEEQIHRTVQG